MRVFMFIFDNPNNDILYSSNTLQKTYISDYFYLLSVKFFIINYYRCHLY